MRSIRVETSSATILLTEAPETKVKDRKTGEIATDAVSGEALKTVGVVYIEDGESSLLKVTVPASGVAEGLALGSPVAARPGGPSLGEHVQRSAAARHRVPRHRRDGRRVPDGDRGLTGCPTC